MAQASMTDMGQKIMLLGLFVQLLFFGFFVVISVIFYMRMRSSPQRHTIPQYGKYGWPALVGLSHIMVLAPFFLLRAIHLSSSRKYTLTVW